MVFLLFGLRELVLRLARAWTKGGFALPALGCEPYYAPIAFRPANAFCSCSWAPDTTIRVAQLIERECYAFAPPPLQGTCCRSTPAISLNSSPVSMVADSE
jgi:hypothetical protein